jgi:transforming growth factor-beta-induced protein
LRDAILQQNLQGALQNPSATLTVFAPTNAAFEALAAGLNTDIDGILALPNLTDVLLYHVLGSTVVSGDLTNGMTPQPLNAANTIKITVTSGGSVFANQAQVTTANIGASNGVVHVTDGVLLPVTTVVDLAINNNFTILTTAVIQQELVPALSNPLGTFTVFAPTDAAFGDLLAILDITAEQLLADENLTAVLLYHVLGAVVPASAVSNGLLATPLNDLNTIKMTVTSTGDVYANQAQVILPDVNAFNGVVHAIDAVILPLPTVVDVAINNDFNYLVAALVQEEFLPVLTNPFAAFTVFAPTDLAFEELAAALETDIDGLLALPTLSTVLLYHVIDGIVASTDLENGTVNTLANITVNVNVDAGVLINTSTVILADVAAFNGIVHVIDRVLVPGGSPVSVPNFDNVSITAYPNPASTVVSFTGLNEADLNIVDINGSTVFSGKYNGNPIDISNLSSGMYFIYVAAEQNTSVVRLSVK